MGLPDLVELRQPRLPNRSVTAEDEDAAWAAARIAELERWQTVDLENYKRHLAELEQRQLANIADFNSVATKNAELEEMLTAATDVAVQRGKRIDAVRQLHTPFGMTMQDGPREFCNSCEDDWPCLTIEALDGADGG